MIAMLLLGMLLTPPGERLDRFEYSEIVMGAKARIVVYAPDGATARRAVRSAFDRMAGLDSVMSDYRPDSELMRLCARAGAGPVPVGRDLFAVLRRAQEVASASGGAFDATVGPVTRLWRRARARGEPPDPDALRRARARVGYGDLVLDAEARTVELRRPGMFLDLGGIGKGFAADAALAALRRAGLPRALVDHGGDVAAGAPPPGRAGWRVAVALETPVVVTLTGQAVATSGDAEQHLDVDGRRLSHLIDPRTGTAVADRPAVAVVAPEGATADALASALSVLDAAGRAALLSRYPEARLVAAAATDPQRP